MHKEAQVNWEAIGALAEVFGAIGVIVTLIYLSTQIRQGNQDTRAASLQQLNRDYADHCAVVMSDENVAAFIKGLVTYDHLSPEERLKFDACAAGYVNMVESTLYQSAAGRLDEVLDMLRSYLGPRMISYPGFESWWHHGQKGGFGSSTQEWFDREIEKWRGGPRFWHLEEQVPEVAS